MYRSRLISRGPNWRYPAVDRAGVISPCASRNRIFETETSGKSSRRRLMTSPMERGSSTIAPRHEELEAADHHLVARIESGGVDPGIVDIGPVGRAQVFHLQMFFMGVEAAMLT